MARSSPSRARRLAIAAPAAASSLAPAGPSRSWSASMTGSGARSCWSPGRGPRTPAGSLHRIGLVRPPAIARPGAPSAMASLPTRSWSPRRTALGQGAGRHRPVSRVPAGSSQAPACAAHRHAACPAARASLRVFHRTGELAPGYACHCPAASQHDGDPSGTGHRPRAAARRPGPTGAQPRQERRRRAARRICSDWRVVSGAPEQMI